MKTKIVFQTEITYTNESITLIGTKETLKHILTYLANIVHDAAELASWQKFHYTSKCYLEFRQQLIDNIKELEKIPD